LVLDFVDGTLGSPVNTGGKVVSGEPRDHSMSVLVVRQSSEMSLSLILGHGGELVVASNEGVVWIGVNVMDIGISACKLLESEIVLFLGSIA
jgi:hypothetical protein